MQPEILGAGVPCPVRYPTRNKHDCAGSHLSHVLTHLDLRLACLDDDCLIGWVPMERDSVSRGDPLENEAKIPHARTGVVAGVDDESQGGVRPIVVGVTRVDQRFVPKALHNGHVVSLMSEA